MVRAGAPAAAGPSEQGLAAAVGVAWGTSADPSLELLQLLPLSPGPHWSSARAVLLPPPGCDRARAVLLASGGPVLFDRVVLVERALPEPRRRAVEGAGVSARVGQGGVVVLERGERPLLHALVPVVLGPGAGADPLLVRPVTLWAEARALGAAPTDPSAGSGAGSAATGGTNSAGAAAAGGGQGWQIDGAALLVPAGMPIGCTAAVRPGADGTLEFSWKLGGGVPPAGRPALWLHLADAAALAELQRVPAGAQGGAADGTAASGPVRELVFGEGAAAVSLTLSPPLAVSTRRLGGGGALLLLTGPEGGTELRLEVGRSSSRARELLEQQLADAAELERQGRLEAARALYARLAREAWQPEVRTQAAQRAEALAERARAALAQAATLEQDANALGVAPLLEAAAARCRFVCEAFPGTGWAERAAQALERIELAHRRLAQQRRLQAARALYERARHQLEARRFRLGRALLQELLLAYGEVDELAARARQDLEFANAALEGRR
ncbi:MAG: hypothetical protein KatS3mg102_0575 [Planctomycetota bacterium]|nr:MAG: hypothetical protein KatS3mg102_0575 [Planctomycetota bacterium]